MTNVTYGRTCGKPFSIYDPDTHSWKMYPATGLWGSIPYSQTWPQTGCMCGGLASELPRLGGHTTGKEFSYLLPTPTASDSKRGNSPANYKRKTPGLTTVGLYFPVGVVHKRYARAVDRWGVEMNRPAPPPTELGNDGKPHLSASFVEWLMGLPEGWVTDPEIGISRAQQLKALGNGAVPQQAAEALKQLLDMEASLF